jgi:hypothetical protein
VVANADVEDVVAGGETREAEESVAASTWARLRSIFRRGSVETEKNLVRWKSGMYDGEIYAT